MTTVRPPEPPNKIGPPAMGGWHRVVSLTVTAAAVTLTAIFTRSVELAVLVGTVIRPR